MSSCDCRLSLIGSKPMLTPDNQFDKDRFEKLKETEVERGRKEETAIDVAAEQVKELRQREGRSKDSDPGLPR
jgi:hypothetical protein